MEYNCSRATISQWQFPYSHISAISTGAIHLMVNSWNITIHVPQSPNGCFHAVILGAISTGAIHLMVNSWNNLPMVLYMD